MPVTRLRQEKLYKGCAVNRPTLEAFANFADYLDTSRRQLAGRYVEERQDIFDAVDRNHLQRLHEAQRRVLPGYPEAGPNTLQITFSVTPETLTHYEAEVDRLDLSFSWLSRVAILNGLAIEMEQHRYVPGALG